MTNFVSPTSELEAVNAMLRMIGESPLDTIDQTFADADVAKQMLREELRAAQNAEWTFNCEKAVTLTPDGDKHINLPQNTLRVICDPTIVQRGSRLYDTLLHTYEFEEPITADLVVALNFEEIPEALRRFVYIRAGRRFLNDIQPDQVTGAFKAQDEKSAWAAFLNYEREVAQWNVLDNLALNQRIKRYRPGSYSRGAAYGRN